MRRPRPNAFERPLTRFAFVPGRTPRAVAGRGRADEHDAAEGVSAAATRPAPLAASNCARRAPRLARLPQQRAGPAPSRAPARPRLVSRARAGRQPVRDAVGPLPHLQVGLGAAGEVVDDLVAGELAQVLEPVGVQAVVGDAVVLMSVALPARCLSIVCLPSKDLNG